MHGQDPSAADLLVPVGLSFFTFQSLSYTIDIYRRKLAPAPSVLDFLFFVSFFPHLVAGPIVRAADFLPQVRKKVRLSLAEMDEAFLLIASGLLKKVIIADTLALRLVDPVFSDPARHTGPECLLGLLGYSAQIYGDFSGYTDLALGLALLLGFRLCVNFDQPYRAASLTTSSGSAGTSACPSGCATISTSPWAATATASCGPTSTSWSPCCWAGSGMGPAGATWHGAACTAWAWPSSAPWASIPWYPDPGGSAA